MQLGQELLQKWDARAARLHPRLEITGDGLVLGAGTILAKMVQDGRGAPLLLLDDEPRILTLISTGFEQPVEPYLLAKISRACELWNDSEKALAHIHLAHAGLPQCDEQTALRLFVADELLVSGVTPAALMKAQGFDPAPLDLLKFNPARPRVPAGNGQESGQWTGGNADITPVAFRGSKGRRGRRGGGGVFDAIHSFLEWLRERPTPRDAEPAPERNPGHEEGSKPESEPPREPLPKAKTSAPKPSDFVGQDFGKLGTAVEKPDIVIGEITGHANQRMAEYGQSFDDIRNSVSDPLIVLRQSDGRYYFLSDNGAVVLDQQGRVVTTYPSWKFEPDVKSILDHIRNGGNR